MLVFRTYTTQLTLYLYGAVAVEQAVQQFYWDPSWVAANDPDFPCTMHELVARTDDGSICGGSEIRRLARLDPRILAAASALLDICHDWLQPYPSNPAWTVVVRGIRCAAAGPGTELGMGVV